MHRLLTGRNKKDKEDSSDIQIYYNIQFPLDDILDVLYPLFGQYYLYDDFIYMIYTINHILCAYDNKKRQPIACALLNNDNVQGVLYLMLFGVRQESQRRGTGTYLLQNVIQWARQGGYRFIHLHVHIHNSKAIGLYEKVGFRQYEYLPNFYGNLPKHPPHAIRMVLSLW